jgi:hypothetical protein
MAIAGALAIGAAIVFGFVMFLLLAAIVVVLAAVVGIRIWWVGRRLRKLQETAMKQHSGRHDEAGIIEGEYHVVSSHRTRDRR